MPPVTLESLDNVFQHCSSMEHDFLMPNGIILTVKVFNFYLLNENVYFSIYHHSIFSFPTLILLLSITL